jgi:diaminopimelate epimerase
VGVNPGAPDLEHELNRFYWKVEAGAEYAITQPVFDVDQLLAFIEEIERAGIRIPIVAGIWPLVSARNAEFLANEVPGVVVPMGPASFRSGDVHYSDADADAEVMGHRVAVDGEDVQVHLVSLGNPHCVVFVDELDPASFRRLAPRLQALPAFERGVNVQFARVVGPDAVEAMVWERGAGETLASGSSACAVAAAGRRTGALHGSTIRVEMPGGGLDVDVADDWRVHLSGPAQIVYEGRVPSGVLQAWR